MLRARVLWAHCDGLNVSRGDFRRCLVGFGKQCFGSDVHSKIKILLGSRAGKLLVIKGRAIGSFAIKELVGEVAKAKVGIHSEGNPEEAFGEEALDPESGTMTCLTWVVLMTI